MTEMFPKFDVLMQHIWTLICKHCSLRCHVRVAWARRTPSRTPDVLIDAHWALPLDQIDALAYRLVFYHWDPGKMGKYFHFNGNLLATVGAAETFAAQAMRRPRTAMSVRVNQEMRSSGGFVFNWRKSLMHLGFQAGDDEDHLDDRQQDGGQLDARAAGAHARLQSRVRPPLIQRHQDSIYVFIADSSSSRVRPRESKDT